MTEPRTIRWGIIGCGDVAEVKSGPAFQKARHSALVAVMRRNGDLARDYARRHGVPRWYDDAEALVRDPEVDAVYVATPPSTHCSYTLLAAGHGKPVYVEKPMAINAAECDAMIEACRAAGVPLFTAYYRRGLPRFLKVKALLEAGAVGRVSAASIMLVQPHVFAAGALPWHVDPAIAGGGLFVDLACHTLDLLDDLLGPITTVHGHALNLGGHYPAEDLVAGAFTFAPGVGGTGLWCFTADRESDEVVIVGAAGRIVFSTFANAPIRLERDGTSVTFDIPHPAHVQQPLIQTVVDAINGEGTCPSTGESGARTTRVMDALLRSYYQQHPS